LLYAQPPSVGDGFQGGEETLHELVVWLFRFFVGEKFPQLVFVGKVVNRLVQHFLHPPLVELRHSRFVYIHLENVLPLEFAHRFFVTIFSNETDELVHALVELFHDFLLNGV